MNYKETVKYLYELLPMYQRVGGVAIKKDLKNITALCEELVNPHVQYKSIHIGGTNGKGTVSHIVSSILQEAGYKVGLYTSPHYVDFRERIKINGQLVPESFVVQFVMEMQKHIEKIKPSFFEMTVAMAFQYFYIEQVDFAVIEVGLGGRLDSTNIVTPCIAAITNIGLDHQNMLGDTLEEIAGEKAGIIKRNTPIIIGEHDNITAPIFKKIAEKKNSTISFANQSWEVTVNEAKTDAEFTKVDQSFNITSDYKNPFLHKNVSTALEIVTSARIDISKKDVVKGVENFVQNASYIGRWQCLEEAPDIIADSGHNEHALRHSFAAIQSMSYRKLHFVLGFVKDKDIAKLLRILPKNGKYYFSKPSISRGAAVSSYIKEIDVNNLDYQHYMSLSSALLAAKRSAQKKDLIFIGGSSFVVGEILEKMNT